jgi:hypothetical protein
VDNLSTVSTADSKILVHKASTACGQLELRR